VRRDSGGPAHGGQKVGQEWMIQIDHFDYSDASP
jgi:hypothetical protein